MNMIYDGPGLGEDDGADYWRDDNFMPTKTTPPNGHAKPESREQFKCELLPKWELQDLTDPMRRLFTTVLICGVHHHLEAVPVKRDEDDQQVGLTPEADDYLGEMFQAFGGDGAFSTLEIEGQEYCVFMSPYCV